MVDATGSAGQAGAGLCVPGLSGARDPVGLLGAAREAVDAARAAADAATEVAWESTAAAVFHESMRELRTTVMWDLHSLDEAIAAVGAHLRALDDARLSTVTRTAGGLP